MTDTAEQLESIIPLIRLVTAERVRDQHWLFEDAEQEARIAAWMRLEEGYSTKLAVYKARQQVVDVLRGGRMLGSRRSGGVVDTARRAVPLIRSSPDGSEEYAIEPADHSSAVEQERFEARDALRAALTALPARDREIVHARFYEGLSQAEIAERHGVSPQRVSQILRTSMDRMREVIAA